MLEVRQTIDKNKKAINNETIQDMLPRVIFLIIILLPNM